MPFTKGHKINVGRKFPPMTKEHCLNISKALKGRKLSVKTRTRMGISRAAALNVNWKGDGVGYISLHQWIYRKYGKPNKCENKNCKYPRKNSRGILMLFPKRYEWANVDGKYTRDRKSWLMLCPSCHRTMDINRTKE